MKLKMMMCLVVIALIPIRAIAVEWEYRIVELVPNSETEQLDDLGSHGWELCAPIKKENAGPTFIFKRHVNIDNPKLLSSDVSDWIVWCKTAKQLTLKDVRFEAAIRDGKPMIWMRKEDFENSAIMSRMKAICLKFKVTVYELKPLAAAGMFETSSKELGTLENDRLNPTLKGNSQ